MERVAHIVRKCYEDAPGAFLNDLHRYILTRRWSDDRPVVWIMLNPSTADSEVDDPTIRKCVGFSKRWGAGGIAVVNLCAWRATSPRDLFDAKRAGLDVFGPHNEQFILHTVAHLRPSRVVAAWGNNGRNLKQWDTLRRIMVSHDLWCLDATKLGEPVHPLYQPYVKEPFIWKASA